MSAISSKSRPCWPHSPIATALFAGTSDTEMSATRMNGTGTAKTTVTEERTAETIEAETVSETEVPGSLPNGEHCLCGACHGGWPHLMLVASQGNKLHLLYDSQMCL